MKVSVIGAGIFGSTAAIYLARAGHDVHLFDKGPLLGGASRCNQLRMHRGYHYPRSPETVAECQRGNRSFYEEYPRAVITKTRPRTWQESKYYALARERNRTSAGAYAIFMDEHNLPYQPLQPYDPIVNPDTVQILFRVMEGRFDYDLLAQEIERKLVEAGVYTYFNIPKDVQRGLRWDFDQTVLAGYSANGALLEDMGLKPPERLFELVEKPLIKLPDHWQHHSIVIMDGPFCSVDPYGDTGLHALGHVSRAIHNINVGTRPHIPPQYEGVIDAGVVTRPPRSRSMFMIEDARRYIPLLKDAEWRGSMFTVRAVLPDRDHDDARPTLVTRHSDKVLSIFSGKISSAVEAAKQVVEKVA